MSTIVPTGLPAWTRTADFTSYGGNTEKRNHLGGGVIDATTDVGAEDFSRMVADLAAVVRAAPMWVLTYLNMDASPAAPTIQVAHGMTGVRLLSYVGSSAPVGFPSAVRNGVGDVTFTFSGTYLDEYGVSGTFAVANAEASCNSTGAYIAVAQIVSATTVRVRCFSGGSAVSDQRVTLVVG